ncbi:MULTISPECIES: restriction endonuclease subunit S [unclassified Methylophilus]|uniref:restriction endonuclease subunit S n=1 Tax=unclassified Methylophilus TaxID=2630143 RepID=UPI0006FE2DF2|nr:MULTISPECIES: restriction endonuclease subunit S [unclassified Methylophilus]KQT41360.1 hypothetical protein ASG34_11505 [Methylophilus sp. Leaf416]KQT57881.1 hypothetical protein ASG44_13105 [Methylophilus sp. Leaf459]
MANIANLLTQHMAIWTAADTEKKSGRGRASGNAGSVYGVKKLRELILELAVRGKLVPQYPTDEPASELLKRIQAEKAKLIAEGKLKKEKPFATRNEKEKPFELPIGWEWTELNEVADVIRGVTYGRSDASDDQIDEHVPLLRGNNIDRILNFDKPVYVPRKFLSESQFIKKGDIVIAMSSGSADLVGKAAQAQIDFDGGFGAFCGVVRSYSIELFNYFSYFFQTPYYRKVVAGYGKGIGINNLQKSSLILLNLPIPPLAEQHRIVAKVDELMALCDQLEQQYSNAQEAHEILVSQLLATLTQSQNAAEFNANWQRIYAHFDVLLTTEASIDALKQTLLQLAVMGKLVPQDPNDEPASALLKRIQAEKAKLIAEGKLKKEKPLAPIGEDEKPFELPKAWELVRKAEVLSFLNGYAFKSEWFEASGVRLLRNINISHSVANWDDVVKISDERAANFKEYNLEVGDIVLSLDRPIITTGLKYAVISKADVPCLLLQRVARISSLQNSVITEYLAIWLKSKFFVESIDPGRSNGVPHISTIQVSNMIFCLPPLAEQHRIVAKVDALIALCDQLKTRIQQANQQKQVIADAFVAQAVA